MKTTNSALVADKRDRWRITMFPTPDQLKAQGDAHSDGWEIVYSRIRPTGWTHYLHVRKPANR